MPKPFSWHKIWRELLETHKKTEATMAVKKVVTPHSVWRVISAKISHPLQTRRQPLKTLNQYELDSECEPIPVNFTLPSCAN